MQPEGSSECDTKTLGVAIGIFSQRREVQDFLGATPGFRSPITLEEANAEEEQQKNL